MWVIVIVMLCILAYLRKAAMLAPALRSPLVLNSLAVLRISSYTSDMQLSTRESIVSPNNNNNNKNNNNNDHHNHNNNKIATER